jgi:hypothetical protein
MESALYFVTMGEGRLKEAKKEFQEVLRYDKNNKAAKEYLKKLEAQARQAESTSIRKRPININKKHIITAGGILAVLIVVFLIKVLMGIKYNTETLRNLLKPGTGTSDSTLALVEKGDKGKDASVGGNKTAETSTEQAQEKPKPPVNRVEETAVKNEKPVAKKKPTQRQRQSSSFAYPHQNLKEYGTLLVKTNVSADISIDKINYGKSNGPPIKLSPGRHFIEIKATGYRRMTRRLFTEKGEQVEIEVNLMAE